VRPLYKMQFYRVSPGDVPVRHLPAAVGETLEQAEEAAGKLLLDYWLDQKKRPQERPHHVQIVDEQGNIIVRLRATPPRRIERAPLT
jgi:hypothetical protein